MSGWNFKLPKKLVDREKLILDLCENKKVLHLGCVDYPIASEKIERGEWLHSKICQVANRVLGIDINCEGVSYLVNNHNIGNIICADVQSLSGELFYKYGSFDLIVAGEIIEHLSNPGLFLDGINMFMNNDSVLLITTTNAYSLKRFIKILTYIEGVHSDHTFYFSHSVLTRLLSNHNYDVVDRMNYSHKNIKPFLPYLIEKCGSIINPNYCDGLIYLAKKGKKPKNQKRAGLHSSDTLPLQSG